MHIGIATVYTDEKSGFIAAYKDSYWSHSWPEKSLEEMTAKKQEMYWRKPSSGVTSGKVFPGALGPTQPSVHTSCRSGNDRIRK